MHLAARVVFQNLECLMRFGPPRSIASSAETMENLGTETSALWRNWTEQIAKVCLMLCVSVTCPAYLRHLEYVVTRHVKSQSSCPTYVTP